MSNQPGSVIGVRDTLRVLKLTDEKLYWGAINKIKGAAEPLAREIDATFPGPPPGRGWNHKGRTGWNQPKKTTVQYGGKRTRSQRSNQVWPLVKVKVMDAPRMIYDMAGAAGGSNINLDNQWGKASRAVWRVATNGQRRADKAVKQAIREVSASQNRALKVVR